MEFSMYISGNSWSTYVNKYGSVCFTKQHHVNYFGNNSVRYVCQACITPATKHERKDSMKLGVNLSGIYHVNCE